MATRDLELCIERVQVALAASEQEEVERLAEANTTVALRIAGSGDGVTFLFDRCPVEMLPHLADAEISLTLSQEAFVALTEGSLILQREILQGTVTYEGPVRKLLSVAAPLSSVFARRFSPTLEPGEPRENVHTGAPVLAGAFEEHAPGDFWAIECRDVHKRLGRSQVLEGVNLGIPEGMITVIMGPSGTGKSVLLKHLIGLLAPDSGEVRVRGRSLATMSLNELLRLRTRCGVLFQDGALWGSMSVADNVALPLRQHTNLPERQIVEVVREALARVGLGDAGGLMPSQLSGGMRKRAGFARALVLDPDLIFFDEPDSGLDPVRTALLADLVAGMHKRLGGTYVIITHNIAVAQRIADYVAVLWKGQIVQAGPTEDVYSSPHPFVKQFLRGETAGPLAMD
jgi:phospholipid/cholesterol/gamma-HCH transport system ATP-binding protein